MKYLFLSFLLGLLGVVACSPRTAQIEGNAEVSKSIDTSVIISPSTERRIIYTEKAPKPVGPYSQAIFKNNTLYVAGQLGIDPKTGLLVGDSIDVQTRQALENIKVIVEEAGLRLSDVVQTTVYLKNINDFNKMNKVYATYFGGISPARATIEVAAIPLKAKVEIVAVAAK
ncbi:Rid family detoxifying hydrolase [Thermoflexibacter ruber]|uniref:Endoribonuclease L-PSP n=1 Tax=Thermoflexibacter ruber TaxID=1003 RepID=A0A1I2JBF9_9BACT|nr:Rid family detoxifying hydrolase [Thermoflexibacter ruber]SFF51310.1 endoribonuclease L-PSP [Thermoflexibacter ruber]